MTPDAKTNPDRPGSVVELIDKTIESGGRTSKAAILIVSAAIAITLPIAALTFLINHLGPLRTAIAAAVPAVLTILKSLRPNSDDSTSSESAEVDEAPS